MYCPIQFINDANNEQLKRKGRFTENKVKRSMIKYFIVQQAVKEIYLNCQNSDNKKLEKKFHNKNQPKTSEQSN